MKCPKKVKKNCCIDDKTINLNNTRITIFFIKTIKNKHFSYTCTNLCVSSLLKVTISTLISVLSQYAFLNPVFFHKMIYKCGIVPWDVHLYNVSRAVVQSCISLDISYGYIFLNIDLCLRHFVTSVKILIQYLHMYTPLPCRCQYEHESFLLL